MAVWAKVALIFIGAGLGANARYWLACWVQSRVGEEFPWGTILVNVSGSLAMGAMAALLVKPETGDGWRLMVAVGLLGGYTTFSTFSAETLSLLRSGSVSHALWNIALTNFGSLLACALAYLAMERLLAWLR
ncbi:MAG: fluoride efflux transporter CrcB [Fimbriimonadaceae bacterium]